MNTVDQQQPQNSAAQIEQKLRALDGRDLQLWSMALIIVVVISAGFCALVAPQLASHFNAVVRHDQNFVVLFVGLICLLFLLNIYLFQERQLLLRMRP